MAAGEAGRLDAEVHYQHRRCADQLHCNDDVLPDEVHPGMAGIRIPADSAAGVPPDS
ncbi:hypothetical protein D3C75_1284550 [compost metagenome]